jgi:glycosidase
MSARASSNISYTPKFKKKLGGNKLIHTLVYCISGLLLLNFSGWAQGNKPSTTKNPRDTKELTREVTILELEKYIAPSSKMGDMIRFKKPNNTKEVEFRTKSDDWKTGYKMTPNKTNPEVVELDIKSLNLPEGRYEFKFILDGKFEKGYNRVLWIGSDGLLIGPKGGRPILREESHNTNTLSFLDNNYTFLEITHQGDKWKTRTPLEFKDGYWNIDIEKLRIKEGSNLFKLIVNGDLEEGADRIVHIEGEESKKVVIKDPRRTKVVKVETPEKTLKAISPNTTYLAIKTNGDGWDKEFVLENKNGTWELDINKLGLKKGEYSYKFITSEGMETGEDRKFSITENGEVFFPKPWAPMPLRTKNPSSILYFRAPHYGKVQIAHSANGWTERIDAIAVKDKEGVFAINTKELNIPEGKTLYKFVLDGEFEEGKNRKLILNKEGLIVEPSTGRAMVREESHNEPVLSFMDNYYDSVEITHEGNDWKKSAPLKLKDGVWKININRLGIPEGTYRYKLIIDGEMEQGADRLLYVTGDDIKRVNIKYPRKTRVLKNTEPSNLLRAISPNTTYLAIKTDGDKWEKEFPMENKEGIWELDIDQIGLEEGTYKFKFITSEGFEAGADKNLFINSEKKIYFPEPWSPVLLRTKAPSSVLYFKSLPDEKIQIAHNSNGWSERFDAVPIKGKRGIYGIDTSKIGIFPGKTLYKFIIDGEWEEGTDRILWTTEEGKIFTPIDNGPIIWDGFSPYPNLRVQDDNVTSLRLKHSGNGWTDSIPFNLVDGIWSLNISSLGLPSGVYEYKLERDLKIEGGVNRILQIVDASEHVRIDPKVPEIIQLKAKSPLLVVSDPNTNYLAIKHEGDKWEKEYQFEKIEPKILKINEFFLPVPEDRKTIKFQKPKESSYVEIRTNHDNWEKGIPLEIDKDNPEILTFDVSTWKLPEGRHEFKFVIDGKFEEGPNRTIWIDGEGLMQKDQLSQIQRKTTWVLNTAEADLKPGRTEFKLVSSSGMEPGSNRVLHIGEDGNITFPVPENPVILNKTTPSDKLEVLAPNNTDIGIRHSGDNWEKIHKLKRKGDTWSITRKELGLEEGTYEFKIMIGEGYDSGPNQKMTIGEDGQIILIPKELLNIPEEKTKIKINAPKASSLQLRHSENWSKMYPFTKEEDEKWALDIRTIGVEKNKRIFFKLVIDEKTEDGPDRAGYISEEGEFIIESPPPVSPILTDPALLVREDPYFIKTIAINPNPELSMKGTSDWYNSARMYHLWVPSFKDSKKGSLANDGIGDLRGVIDALKEDYFSQLGVNSIWLSPIFSSGEEDWPTPEMSGYQTKDFYQINKNFGTKEDLIEILKLAHSKDIRIILEYVPNHVGTLHPWFIASRDPTNENHETFKDWFVWKDKPIEKLTKSWNFGDTWHKDPVRNLYYYGFFSGYLPDLNYRNRKVAQEMANVAIYWLNLGVDGFRIDANKHIFENFDQDIGFEEDQPESFELFQELRRVIDEFDKLGYKKIIIAENWTTYKGNISRYGRQGNKDGFDLSLNFRMLDIIKGTAAEETPDWVVVHLKDEQPENIGYIRFLSNHDYAAPRAKTNFGTATKLATNINMLLPGPYIIYYGEELAMEGSIKEELRAKIDWRKLEDAMTPTNSDDSSEMKDNLEGKIQSNVKESFEQYRKLGGLRTKYERFFASKDSAVIPSDDENQIFIKYKLGDEQLLLVLNTRNFEEKTRAKLPSGVKVMDVLEDKVLTKEIKEGRLDIQLEPYGVRAFLISKEPN